MKKILSAVVCLVMSAGHVFAQTDADRAAIRAHIEGITQAFIDGDIAKIRNTHAEDWRGFLESTQVPIRGIDEYMIANGLPPKPGNDGTPHPNPARGFKINDFDVNFYSPDFAVVCFMLDFLNKSGPEPVIATRLRIMDVYARRNGGWIQVASHTVTDPTWRSQRIAMPGALAPQARQQLLDAREAVWRAFFAGDQAALEKLIPDELIAIDEGGSEWGSRASILAAAKRFAESGGKLVRLEFPKTEMQVYGPVVIIYTTYSFDLDRNGQKSSTTGRATEMFVRRNNAWLNVGWHLDR